MDVPAADAERQDRMSGRAVSAADAVKQDMTGTGAFVGNVEQQDMSGMVVNV